MNIDTAFLRRCLDTLERALGELKRSDPDDIAYDIYRAACVKEFEIVLEQSGKLLRKRLGAYFSSNRQADRLVFKESLPARRQTWADRSRHVRALAEVP